ncbi:MAG: transposase [Anaerolineaceae bacterium]|nr:transposase [Anaerolineaceae bacterium]
MRLKRADYENGRYYHFYNRGAHRQSIFREPDNYLYVLKKMQTYVQEFCIAVIAYCLLPNHYHFLLRQDGDQPASFIPQRTFNSYSKAYNKRYQHSGTLFEGNFEVKPVNDEPYLLHLCKYIHANPLKHGLVKTVDEWPYSNYHEWMQTRAGKLVDHQFVNDFFPDRQDYAADVRAYALGQKHWPEAMNGYFYDDV